MKKDIRAIVASGDNAGLVDHGFDVNTQLNNLSFEDKGIKTKIGEAFGPEMNDGETSVRIEGSTAAAILTAAEKLDIDASAKAYPDLMSAVKAGQLKGVVVRELNLVVPPDFIEKAVEALKAAGISASVVEDLSVSAGDFRKAMNGTTTAALNTLKDCVKRDVSFRIKYERK